ncbi:MAG: lysyl-tRNA synthetase [Chlamydiae bacterium SM23_39]|nr:MAG: lysyl-tRNA synthetase [Chlamydiae bacterium SM23_39]
MDIKKTSYQKSEEFINRSKKLKEIRSLNIDPYPHKFSPNYTFNELKEKYGKKEVGNSEDAKEGKTENIKIAGRLVLFRAMGKNAFSQIQDEEGRIQIMFNKESTQVEGLQEGNALKFIEKKIDLGDIIGIEGNIFRTQKGELTIFAKKVNILCKSLLPLPDKYSGLADKGTRYKKRWLDLISKKEVVDNFILRSKIIKAIREYLDNNGFLEVETPILQNVYGGAEAHPFKTHLNALHQDMFLRISLEIPLKKLIVGGFLKIYEIGKVFRNEGIDKIHNPEFTEIEAYVAYADYNDIMSLVENLFEAILKKIFKTTKIQYEDKIIDLTSPWIKMTMIESIKKYAQIDINNKNEKELIKILEKKIDISELKEKKRGELIALIFEEFVIEKLIQPHHIIDHPIETTPLCKMKRDSKERLVERFESFILGKELINAYTELNDPELQRKLLEEQILSKSKKKEIPPLDEDFIEAICQGMPPTGGFGMGIDRLVMFLSNATSIRDVIFFPIIKLE